LPWSAFLSVIAVVTWAAAAVAQTTNDADAEPPASQAPRGELQDPESFWSRFKDPIDGRFDVTAGGEGGRGVLPLLIPFNDPAVGAGALAALIYFHPDRDSEETEPDRYVPPTTSFAGAARSDNDSWVVAGGHSAAFKSGRIRYLGAIGTASVNLDFYGIGDNPELNENPLSFNLEGDLFLQQVQFRLGSSHAAAGLRFSFLEANTTFGAIPDFDIALGETNDAGLGVFAEWDTRDTTFTPSSGMSLIGTLSAFSKSFGGDFDYAKFTLASRTYWPLHDERLIVGLRADYAFVGGDAPFYALNWVALRGVPAFRYLGNHTLTMEVEPRWKVDERWSIVGFAGLGRAATDASKLSESEAAYNYGAGFRYLLARRLGLGAGIDLAQGPEDFVIVLTFGSAWGL
jgi:hypothetical protein